MYPASADFVIWLSINAVCFTVGQVMLNHYFSSFQFQYKPNQK